MIRPYQDSDLDALYHICLKTGDSGEDASHLYEDAEILGHFYAAPYVHHEPELAFVVEDMQGVAGYILGTLDSLAFYNWLHDEWFGKLREQLPEPTAERPKWTRTERLYYLVHHPKKYYPDSFKAYPAHLHIDLLPRVQRQGYGTQLMQRFLTSLRQHGSRGVHLGMGASNSRALAFYQKVGFHVIDDSQPGSLYLGLKL
jgi:ribosomal protein S18 acetylase RimI-like enzyme